MTHRRAGSHTARRLRAACGVLLLAATACGTSAGEDPSAATGSALVDEIVDGDTLVVRLAGQAERVRLIGIDTPETKDPRSPVMCFGAETAARLAELVPEGSAVRLVRDVEARDRYGRLLAYVYRVDDGAFINLLLAAEGYAAVLTYPPNVAHTAELSGAVAQARREGRGLWGSCGGPEEPLPG